MEDGPATATLASWAGFEEIGVAATDIRGFGGAEGAAFMLDDRKGPDVSSDVDTGTGLDLNMGSTDLFTGCGTIACGTAAVAGFREGSEFDATGLRTSASVEASGADGCSVCS